MLIRNFGDRRLIGIVAVGLLMMPSSPATAQPSALLDHDDRVLLAEAFRLAEHLQDSVWAPWSDAPFGVLLVTPEHEFLVRHPDPSDDFALAGYDASLDSIYVRELLRDVLAPDDYRYFSFQVWQEGVARYIEYKTAQWASQTYVPTDAFKSLRHYKPFAVAASDLKDRIMRRLATMSLGEDKRVTFYPIGAGEALLLDRTAPAWQRRYWADKFFLERHFTGDRNQP